MPGVEKAGRWLSPPACVGEPGWRVVWPRNGTRRSRPSANPQGTLLKHRPYWLTPQPRLEPIFTVLCAPSHRQQAKSRYKFRTFSEEGAGKIAPPAGADLIALSAHKLYGPKGIGALWVRDGLKLTPLIHGGGQEQGLRSGTLSPALCAGFGAAAKLAVERMEADTAHVDALWRRAMDMLPEWSLNG